MECSGLILSTDYTYAMSFSRFHDDPARIAKQLQQSVGPGQYAIDVPGNGPTPCFMVDPYVRMQRWGANLETNPVALESDLMGLTRTHCRDNVSKNLHGSAAPVSRKVSYPSCGPMTAQPRAMNPAWMLRGLEQPRWETPILDPQCRTDMPFRNNLTTRTLERDNFVASAVSPPGCGNS